MQPTGDVHGRARATPQLPAPRAHQAFCIRTYAPLWGPDGGPRRGGPAAGGSGGPRCSRRPARFAGVKGDLLGAHIGVLSTQDIWLHEEFQSAHDVSGLLGGQARGPRQPEAADSEQATCKVSPRLRQQTPASGRTRLPGRQGPCPGCSHTGLERDGDWPPRGPHASSSVSCPPPMRSCLGTRSCTLSSCVNAHRKKARNPRAKMVAPTLRQEELQYVLICPVNVPSLAPPRPPSLPSQGQT